MTFEVRELRVKYGSGRHALTAVDGISFTLPKGTTLGLVGESGCGKSSIARTLVGLVPIAGGQILVDGEDFSRAKARATSKFRRKVQMVFQDPFSSLNPRMNVLDTLMEVMRNSKRSSKEKRAEAERVVDLVGLSKSSLERYPHQFSGGQRQRVAIARALAVQPEIILLDEVTSALDVSVQATILNLLRDLQDELGLSYVFISHDLSSVRYMSNKVAVMYMGRIVETAETNELFAHPEHPYTRALIESIPTFGEERQPPAIAGDVPDPRNPPTGCRFRTRCPIGPLFHPERTICIEQDPQPLAEVEGQVACHFPGELPTRTNLELRVPA